MRSSIEASYTAIREFAAFRVVERDGVAVEGADAGSWLQGQLSQDLDGLEPGDARDTLVLSPKGKIDAAGRVWRRGPERYVIEVEQGFGEALEARLARFKLRVKATLARVRLRVYECRGPAAPEFRRGGAVGVEWPGFFGWDLLLDEHEGAPAGPSPGDDAAFEAARIEAGVPLLGRELTEATIPQEAGDLFVARTVSFTKGCFTGQELVARLASRGANVPRRLVGVVSDERDVRPGDELEAGGSPAGELTSVAWSPGSGRSVALGYLRRSFSVPLEAHLRRPGEQASHERLAEVRALPLRTG
jgi:folate-binding protein YgfZ